MTSGNPVRLLLLFTVPLLIGNIFQQFYSMVDTIVVGRYVGPQALAAVGSTGSMSFFVIGFAGGLMAGFSILTSQCFGALQKEEHKDYYRIKQTVAAALVLTAVISAVIAFVMYFCTMPLLRVLKTPEDIIDGAHTYIRTIFMGVFTSFYYNLGASLMRSVGDSKTPLYLLIISSFLNIGMDFLFVIVFDMGIFGVAFATVIAQAISAILSLAVMFYKYPFLRPGKEHFKPDWGLIFELLRLGVPNAFMNSITAIGSMVLQSVVNSFGSTVVAAHTAASRVEQFMQLPSMTLGNAIATYVGQNSGAKRMDRVKQGVNKAALMVIGYHIVVGFVIFFAGDFFVKLFIDSADAALTADILSYARMYINVLSVTLIFVGLLYIYRSALQGLGCPGIPFWSGVFEMFARTGVSLGLSVVFGYQGVCFGAPTAWVGAVIILVSGYYTILKRKMRLQSQISD